MSLNLEKTKTLLNLVDQLSILLGPAEALVVKAGNRVVQSIITHHEAKANATIADLLEALRAVEVRSADDLIAEGQAKGTPPGEGE